MNYLVIFCFIGFSLQISSNRVGRQIKRNLFIKWVITEPNLPLLFSVPNYKNIDYRWYKHSDNNYVDELEAYNNEFLYSNSANESSLYLMSYNTETHDQLSSYEPIPVGLSQFEQYYFTMIYLQSNFIDTIETKDNFYVFCNLTLLLPKNDDSLNRENLKLIENNLRYKIGLIDSLYERRLNINTKIPRQTRDTYKSSFLRVDLDIGPIVLPKTNIYNKDDLKNNNVTCMLDLFESNPKEGRNLIVRSQLFKAIDTYVPNHKKEDIKTAVPKTTTAKKLSRNSQNSAFVTGNILIGFNIAIFSFNLI